MAGRDLNVVDWHKVRGSGRTFAFVRASHGASSPPRSPTRPVVGDPRGAGMLRGAYRLLRHDLPPEAWAVVPRRGKRARRSTADARHRRHRRSRAVGDRRGGATLTRDRRGRAPRVARRAAAAFICTARVWKALGSRGFEMYPLWVVDWLYLDTPRVPPCGATASGSCISTAARPRAWPASQPRRSRSVSRAQARRPRAMHHSTKDSARDRRVLDTATSGSTTRRAPR